MTVAMGFQSSFVLAVATVELFCLDERNELTSTALATTLSMARTSDPDSATSQFFISLSDNASLDGDDQNGYAVFGKVLVGMDQIEDIGKVATSNIGGMDDVPDSPIEIAGVAKIDCPP